MLELNKVFLTGNLTRDPEVRYLPAGTAVAKLGLAVNRRWFDRNSGERKEDTLFIDINAWEKSAEFCKNYLRKGSGIYVEGRLKLETWEDKQGGGNRSKITVVAERIQFVESKGSSSGGGASAPSFEGGGGEAGADRAATAGPAGPTAAHPMASSASTDDTRGAEPGESSPSSGTKDDLPF